MTITINHKKAVNYYKYTDENGCISIDFEEDNLEKRLIIKDNGIGIASQDINRVFDKGFTGSIGRKYYKSTGMGLYLSNKMAKKLLPSEMFAKVKKTNRLGAVTYLSAALLTALASYSASKVRDKIAEPTLVKNVS